MNALDLLKLLTQEGDFQPKSQLFFQYLCTQLGIESYACLPIIPLSFFSGFIYEPDSDTSRTSLLLQSIDHSIANNEIEHIYEYYKKYYVFCYKYVAPEGYGAALAFLTLTPLTTDQIETIHLLCEHFCKQLDLQIQKQTHQDHTHWQRQLESIQSSSQTTPQRLDSLLISTKNILQLESSALVKVLDNGSFQCLFKDHQTHWISPFETDQNTASLLSCCPLGGVFYYHTPKMRQQLNHCLNVSIPESAIVLSFSHEKQNYYLIFYSQSSNRIPFSFSDISLSQTCLSFTKLFLTLLDSEENELLNHIQQQGPMDESTEAILTINTLGQILYANSTAQSMLALPFEHLIHQPLSKVLSLTTSSGVLLPFEFDQWFQNQALPSAFYNSHVLVYSKDSNKTMVEVRSVFFFAKDQKPIGMALAFTDISQEAILREHISYHKEFDSLTGLLNRDSIFELIQSSLKSAHFGHEHALIYLDIDHLKALNDSFGHVAGDQLLKEVSVTLQSICHQRPASCARFGADEFLILLEHCTKDQAIEFSHFIRTKIGSIPFQWSGEPFPVSVSLGLTFIDKNRSNIDEIIADADAACFGAKIKGRNQVKVSHQEDMLLISMRRQELEWVLEIQKALEEQRLKLSFQPIVPLNTFDNESYYFQEALLRLELPNGQEVSPGAFMDVAERYNIAPRLDRWVINTILNHQDLLFSTLFPEHPSERRIININLSGTTINQNDFLPFLENICKKYTFSQLSRFCFEITETSAIQSLGVAQQLFENIKKLGFKIALDDFGSGMSSFSYLKHFPVDFVKIDGSIVKSAPMNHTDAIILRHIVQAFTQLNLPVIAECVENQKIQSFVFQSAIPYAQGFYLAHPKPFSFPLLP